MPGFIDIPTEQTTAATDVLLGVLAAWTAFSVWQKGKTMAPQKARIWTWAFGLLAFAAFNGAINHGFAWPKATYDQLWYPLNFALGLTIACFLMGVLYDSRGKAVSTPVVLALLLFAFVFFGITLLFPDTFLVFVAYEAVAQAIALGLYARLWYKGFRGAEWLTIGIAVTILAAAVQALGAGKVLFTLIWEFDHNGLFHLIQCVGVLLLRRGVLRSYKGTIKRS